MEVVICKNCRYIIPKEKAIEFNGFLYCNNCYEEIKKLEKEYTVKDKAGEDINIVNKIDKALQKENFKFTVRGDFEYREIDS